MMNQRIRELAEQAFKESDKQFWWSEAVFEKFAELIVRECAIISEEDAVGDDPACCTNTACRIARTIKKHFGVEL